MRVKIRLADVPDFAWKEYHEDQVRVYTKLTEFAFEALKIPLIREWLEYFAGELDIQNVEVRLNRLPHHEAKLLPVEWKRREGFTLYPISLKRLLSHTGVQAYEEKSLRLYAQ